MLYVRLGQRWYGHVLSKESGNRHKIASSMVIRSLLNDIHLGQLLALLVTMDHFIFFDSYSVSPCDID